MKTKNFESNEPWPPPDPQEKKPPQQRTPIGPTDI